ncbi:MAG: argininosuccinate lyase [Deltaproteobacteria bacterium]|nr:MAG: argininosuccinate lyase [Deltaproteobacteria bacterium]
MAKKVWGGRFRQDLDPLVDQFNASIRFDKRLYPYDIRGSIAHCKMLSKQRIISNEEADKIINALNEIKEELDKGKINLEGYEDIHSLVEARLIDKVGNVGGKLHTARSRNDQVALDMRLFIKDAIKEIDAGIKGLQLSLISLAEENLDIIIPGYTHLQKAQPVLLAHHLMAYYEMLKRDRARFKVALKMADIMPLGSAALAGTGFDLDREMVAMELGFTKISKNSMDAVSDRDFVIDFLYASSVLMMHLSRMSEELILWATQEFGFIEISDAYATGSSIMPQKKNPDVLELTRGKTGRIYGALFSLFTVMKGLPLAYNKDMQEDKEATFDAYDTVKDCLQIMAGLIKNIAFKRKNIKKAIEKGYLTATDLAEYLVIKGIPFRDAHELVGRIVLYAMDKKKELMELSIDELKRFSTVIEEDVYDWLDPIQSVNKKDVPGGTGTGQVKKSIEDAKSELAKETGG